jgi:hypothetical protein
MPNIINLNEDDRVMSWASSSNYTSETVVFRSGTNVYLETFDPADMFKIYNSETGTFAADDQTATLLNPPQPEPTSTE